MKVENLAALDTALDTTIAFWESISSLPYQTLFQTNIIFSRAINSSPFIFICRNPMHIYIILLVQDGNIIANYLKLLIHNEKSY